MSVYDGDMGLPEPHPEAGEIADILQDLARLRSRVCVLGGDPFGRASALRSLDDAKGTLDRLARGIRTLQPIPGMHRRAVATDRNG